MDPQEIEDEEEAEEAVGLVEEAEDAGVAEEAGEAGEAEEVAAVEETGTLESTEETIAEQENKKVADAAPVDSPLNYQSVQPHAPTWVEKN